MRPRNLVIEGFLAYRHRTEVDFSDADLFVLSGPTGSGKSSVIDAITFALYGTIPRLDDRRSVAPVISAQADRARVAFSFTVGEDLYTAVRLAERHGSGARVTEARLLRGESEEVLASSPDSVSAEVTRVLGLSYEHFIKAVVLPQGAFADFLTDRPRDRQALLRALLELDLYQEIMQAANLRARAAEARAETIRESLDKLDVPTEEQVAEARAALQDLTDAGPELAKRLGAMAELEERVAASASDLESAVAVVRRLDAITPPSGLESLVEDRKEAIQRCASSTARRDEASARRRGLEEALAASRDPRVLEGWQAARRRLVSLQQELASLDLAGLGETVAEMVGRRDRARAALEETRVEHAAQAIRAGLASGDTCPVCHGKFTGHPGEDVDHSALFEQLSADLDEAERAVLAARDVLSRAEGEAKQLESAIEERLAELADAPEDEALETELAQARELVRQLEAAKAEEEAATEEAEAAQEALGVLEARTADLEGALHAARDTVVSEAPPLPGDDPVNGWRRFEVWRLEALQRRKEEVGALEEALLAGKSELVSAETALLGWLASLGVPDDGAPERDLALATERRAAEVRELEKTMAEAAEMESALDGEKTRARIASALGTHLRANNFEGWLLEEAMEVLIEGANRLLVDLSGGCYSLKVRDSQFEVIDHRNARLTRTARSLSGGETFLVALALALSMAEQLAALTGAASRLESVFLDEGFGSLDQESLDVVADVLDELVGRGRTVGIVTHVRELAERIPHRFEVEKGPETSIIRRVAG